MPRRHVDTAPLQPIAVRRDEAAAILAISIETFDAHVRPYLKAVKFGTVEVYGVAALAAFVDEAASIEDAAHDLAASRKNNLRRAA